MRQFIVFFAIVAVSTLSACADKNIVNEYPMDPEEKRQARSGKLTGDGLILFGGKDKDSGSGAVGAGIGINSYLWRGALDTLSFMPLASADPFGGVIITDWYENPEATEEKFKMVVTILDSKLRTHALRVNVFKKIKDPRTGEWKDTEVNKKVSRDIENKILTRARELRVNQEG